MQPELLLFDIGNTCIKVGLADSRGVMTSYNLRTDRCRAPFHGLCGLVGGAGFRSPVA